MAAPYIYPSFTPRSSTTSLIVTWIRCPQQMHLSSNLLTWSCTPTISQIFQIIILEDRLHVELNLNRFLATERSKEMPNRRPGMSKATSYQAVVRSGGIMKSLDHVSTFMADV